MKSIKSEHRRKSYDFRGHSPIADTLFRFGRNFLPIEMMTIEKIWSSSFCRAIEDEFYTRLPIRKYIKDCVLRYLEQEMSKPFVAIHVRRTDHEDLAKKHGAFTTDEEFTLFVENHHSKDVPVYLATDEYQVQQSFVKLGCKVYKMIVVPSRIPQIRQTRLEHALIDVLIAGHSDVFMGSGFSSYSKLINIYRRNIQIIMSRVVERKKKCSID
jgi:hypothetical protein